MAVEIESGDVYYKGAGEVLLPNCEIAEHDKMRLQKIVAELNSKAIRMLCICVNNSLLGFIAIGDDIRKEAKPSIAALHDAKIRVVLITGDAKETAISVAKEVGILSDSGLVLESKELNAFTDEEVCNILPDLCVVARAYPEDKSRLVRIAQDKNLVVGMTGDGVNDAAALKRADLGFAMGSGTEVAKAAGDIVIVDDNIKSITRAVSFGRTLFESIRKFLVFKLTINFIAMAICIIAPLFGVSSPITVIQMLWINLVMDTLAGLAFGGEKPREEYMKEPPKRRGENLITKPMWHKIMWGSVFGIAVCLWFLSSPYMQNAIQDKTTFATVFFTFFMFLNICNAFNARTARVNLFSGLNKNKAFLIIMTLIVIAQFFIIYYGGAVFRTVPISMRYLTLAAVLSISIIPAEMFRKIFIK
jgi:calcium-translocating P-type ATPase